MKHTLSLTKVMFKQTFQSALTKSFGRKTKKGVSIALAIFLTLYLGGAVALVSHITIKSFMAINQMSLLFLVAFVILSIMITFTSLFSIPSLLYFSKDTERFLVLPVPTKSILCAKLITSYLSTLLITFIFTLPFGFVWITTAGPGIISIIAYVLAILIIPIIPLFIAVILIVLAFRFIPFVKNKELFTYLSTGFALVVSFVIILFSSSGFSDIESIIASIQMGDDQLINLIGLFNPIAKWLAVGIQDSNILFVLLSLAVSVAVAFGSLYILEKPYAHAVVNVGEKSGRKRRASDGQNYAESTKKSIMHSLINYDMRNILRSPTFMMNYFAPLIILPISLMLPIMTGTSYKALLDMAFGFTDLLDSIPVMTLIISVFGIGFLVSFLFSAFTTLMSTAISREGQSLLSLKSMPIDMMDIINAKIGLGTLIMGIIPVLMGLALLILIRFNILYVILFIVGGLIGCICGNIISILPDVYAPKLTWESEQEAVKQNFMAVIPMFSIMIFMGFIAAIMFKTGFTVGIPVGVVLVLALAGVAYVLIQKLAKTRLLEIINKE